MSSNETARWPGLLTSVDIEAVFQGVLDNLELTIEEAGARVTHEPLPTVVGDAGQLTRLLQNLVSNAVKFHGERPPQVHVAARPESGAWVFSVRDNGVGIDPQYHDRLFKMFERLPSATVRPGTGIGLAICKKIIERHGGRIWVESQPGAGATFYFTIPQRQPA